MSLPRGRWSAGADRFVWVVHRVVDLVGLDVHGHRGRVRWGALEVDFDLVNLPAEHLGHYLEEQWFDFGPLENVGLVDAYGVVVDDHDFRDAVDTPD